MIVMMMNDGLVIGLTNRNIEHLMTGTTPNPSWLKLHREVKVRSILIMRGDTKPDIIKQMEAAGVEVPAPIKEEAERNPL